MDDDPIDGKPVNLPIDKLFSDRFLGVFVAVAELWLGTAKHAISTIWSGDRAGAGLSAGAALSVT